MKKRIITSLIVPIIFTSSANADFGFDTAADYTGEAFFSSPSLEQNNTKSVQENRESSHTTPPIKQLRLKLQERERAKIQQEFELAPTAEDIYAGEVETSQYASKDIEDNFEEMTSDKPEADGESIEEVKKTKRKFFSKKNKKETVSENIEDSDNIILDCRKIDYDTDNFLILATGDVSVEFVKQKTTVKADVITFDRLNNTIKAEGNVKVLKSGKTITGEYIFVDMNEENILLEKPLTKSGNIEIRSEKGWLRGDKIIQEKGTIEVKDSFPINFHSGNRGPRLRTMLVPKNETLTEDISKGIITFQAQDIKITQEGEHEIISIKKPRLFKGDRLVFKTPSIKLYTNKNHDYGETGQWEIGSIRGLGLYVGPGFVTKMPKGSVFKMIPMLNYKSGLGAGVVGRFSSGTNNTMLAYGTSTEKFLAYGKQNLDDNLYLQYATNSYMNEWFMGRRRPKYGVSLVYQKGFSSKDFLLKDKESSFTHRFEGGYFHDLDFDGGFEKIKGSDIGTSRFKYMAQARQNIYEYKNKEELKALRFDIISQLSSAIYGTGDTQIVGRLGPSMHLQYKRWMQDIGYFFAVYDDNTPLTRFDIYRYGKQSVYLREYFRVCRWLTLSWFGLVNVSNDSPNGRYLQENAFYFSVGPDDLKFNLGYDFIRETIRCTIEIMMDAKGSKIEYDRFEITQDNSKKKENKKASASQKVNPNTAPTSARILEKAVVENIKEHEDVL